MSELIIRAKHVRAMKMIFKASVLIKPVLQLIIIADSMPEARKEIQSQYSLKRTVYHM